MGTGFRPIIKPQIPSAARHRSVVVALVALAGGCMLTTSLDGLQGGNNPGAGSTGGVGVSGGERPHGGGGIAAGGNLQGGAGVGSGGSGSGGSGSGGSGSGGSGSGGAGSGGSGSGASGSGGKPAGDVLPAWNTSFTAVYLFENNAALGHDSSGNGRDLDPFVTATQNTQTAAQGNASLLFPFNAEVTASSSALTAQPATSFVIGGWFSAIGQGVENMLITSHNGSAGYLVERVMVNKKFPQLRCLIGGSSSGNLVTAPGTFPENTWVHVVCAYDASKGEITAFVNGEVAGTLAQASAGGVTSQKFTIGGQLDGTADEVFFAANTVVVPAAVARIYACGIDGARCGCDLGDPTKYADCGRAAPSCQNLPPCNQAAP